MAAEIHHFFLDASYEERHLLVAKCEVESLSTVEHLLV